MEPQSFILGMGAMLVIALVIVSVVAIVKVLKVNKNFNNTQMNNNHEFENIRKEMDKREQQLYRRCDDIEKAIDSRCDKLYDKIAKEIRPNKSFLDRISTYPRQSDVPVEEEKDSIYAGAKRIMDKLDNK